MTALLTSLVCLAMAMALLYLVTVQTKVSAAHKRYRTALEASHGGVQLVTKEIIPAFFGDATNPAGTLASQFAFINLSTSSNDCLTQKLKVRTSDWTACGAGARSMPVQIDPDLSFRLAGSGGSSGFQVFTKIVDTVPGNSDTSGLDLLDSGTSVTGVAPGVSPKHIPALYRIETEGQSVANPKEKASLTVLYSY